MIIPFIVLFVIIYAFFKKVDVFDSFLDGSKEGLIIIKKMFPSMLGMILAINIFTSSGAINYLFSFLKPIFSLFNIPFEILPIALLRPISGSFGLGLLNDIFKRYGPDSFIGILSSVIQGSSDTTIYIITLYFGVIGIKKIRHSLWVGLLCDLFMVICSIIILTLFYS
ncbi:MAG: spore maturation protein [Bacilli bacterium]|nr:spore maturation protein [Bacilli bacterium]